MCAVLVPLAPGTDHSIGSSSPIGYTTPGIATSGGITYAPCGPARFTAELSARVALQAINGHRTIAEIFNTDQGSQFTSGAFTGRLEQHDIRISMDGRGP